MYHAFLPFPEFVFSRAPLAWDVVRPFDLIFARWLAIQRGVYQRRVPVWVHPVRIPANSGHLGHLDEVDGDKRACLRREFFRFNLVRDRLSRSKV